METEQMAEKKPRRPKLDRDLVDQVMQAAHDRGEEFAGASRPRVVEAILRRYLRGGLSSTAPSGLERASRPPTSARTRYGSHVQRAEEDEAKSPHADWKRRLQEILLQIADEGGITKARGHKAFAKQIGASVSVVKKKLKQLEDEGFIELYRSEAGSIGARYRILDKAMSARRRTHKRAEG